MGWAALGLVLAGTQAFAQGSGLTLDPFETVIGNAQLSLGGAASGGPVRHQPEKPAGGVGRAQGDAPAPSRLRFRP